MLQDQKLLDTPEKKEPTAMLHCSEEILPPESIVIQTTRLG